LNIKRNESISRTMSDNKRMDTDMAKELLRLSKQNPKKGGE